MRAVSLSSEKVQELLRDKFVCAWVNLKGDAAAGASFEHGPNDPPVVVGRGLGARNTQTLLLTPEGQIVNATAGAIGSADLVHELEFTLRTLGDLAKVPEADRKARLTKAHRDYLNQPPEGSTLGVINRLLPNVPEGAIVIGGGRAVDDHKFVINNPLLPVQEFTINRMVGNDPVFFFGATDAPGARPQPDKPKAAEPGGKPAANPDAKGQQKGREDLSRLLGDYLEQLLEVTKDMLQAARNRAPAQPPQVDAQKMAKYLDAARRIQEFANDFEQRAADRLEDLQQKTKELEKGAELNKPARAGAPPGVLMSPEVQRLLKLTPQQKESLAKLQKEFEAKQMELLTAEQKKQLEEFSRQRASQLQQLDDLLNRLQDDLLKKLRELKKRQDPER